MRARSQAPRIRLAPALAGLAIVLATPALAQEEEPSEADRLRDLEKKVEEQQREIDELKRGRAAAPEKSPPKEENAPGAGPLYEWSWRDGFEVKGTIDGAEYVLRPVASLQLDYRAFPHEKPADQFLVRREDVGFVGRFGDFAYMVRVAPTRPGIPLSDVWLQWQTFELLRVRVGHFYAPFTVDNGYQQEFREDLVEAPMALGSGTVISPDYRLGAEVLGSLAGVFNYWLAVTNTLDTNSPASGDPMVTARVELNLLGFVLGGEGSWDRRPEGSTSFPGLTPGQFLFFTPVDIRGWEQRYGVNLHFYLGPFWFRSSYLWAVERRDKVAAGADGASLVTQGAYLTIGWKFWGPPPSAPRPEMPFKHWEVFSFDIEKKHNGRDVGMDVAFRADWIDLRDARNAGRLEGSAPSTAPDTARILGNQAYALCVGFCLYPIENVRVMADFFEVRIGDQARAERAHSRWSDELLFRTQFDF